MGIDSSIIISLPTNAVLLLASYLRALVNSKSPGTSNCPVLLYSILSSRTYYATKARLYLKSRGISLIILITNASSFAIYDYTLRTHILRLLRPVALNLKKELLSVSLRSIVYPIRGQNADYTLQRLTRLRG